MELVKIKIPNRFAKIEFVFRKILMIFEVKNGLWKLDLCTYFLKNPYFHFTTLFLISLSR